jgi:hypothetical protein
MKLPRDVSGADLAKRLGRLGYELTRQTGSEAAGNIVNFLHESRRVLIGVSFFDVTGASACTACKLANVSSPAIRQLFPMSEFAFVLGARCHRASRLSPNCG